MAVKAIAVDQDDVQHLIIGLNRENIDSLLRGDIFKLPSGSVPAREQERYSPAIC
jgi:hypothetical protein